MNKKTFIKITSALLFNAIVGGVIATLLGCSPMGVQQWLVLLLSHFLASCPRMLHVMAC